MYLIGITLICYNYSEGKCCLSSPSRRLLNSAPQQALGLIYIRSQRMDLHVLSLPWTADARNLQAFCLMQKSILIYKLGNELSGSY